jgi:hypothetical protein
MEYYWRCSLWECMQRGRLNMDLKELKEVAKPLVKYLRENGNTHQKIIIDQMSVKIISDDVFIPIVEVNKL